MTFNLSLRTRILVLTALAVAITTLGIASIAQAGPQNGGSCGTDSENQYYLVTNPYGPTDFASDGNGNSVSLAALWGSVYGGGSAGSAVVTSNYDVATVDPNGEVCGEILDAQTLPTVVMVALPATIQAGGSSALTWGSSNASSCTGNGFNTAGATSGTISVSPTQTTGYSVSCTDGVNTANASATVAVTESILAPTATLTANPATITAGGSSTLTWTSTNANSCSINQGVGTVTPTAGGSVTVTPAGSTTYTITCIGDGGEGTATAAVTLNGGPDLTASSVSPTSAVLNQATSLSAVISNLGGAATGATTNNVFQIDSNSDHSSGVASYAGSQTASIPASGSASTNLSRTFTSVGTWYVRVCADNNTGMVGAVTETNESNNCGAWTAISVTNTALGSVSCNVSSTAVAVGETVIYTASPSGGAG
ncbi:hypothetical protein KKH81_01180, partial [Patescibacteria group bacterium]|nr:hypothetical protein [Patescibacteria group bacterium]